ncbi:ATP-binding cassette domain-containing protein, partial [Candidatus Poribacteria bacterium]|nr:ATP-binding cassette domain-containing protein [Candidatus Poribacteria bacterium]
YTPDSGTLEIDGEDIKKINLKDLRRQIGVVLQEPYLFSGTIAENIAYAKPDAPMQEIITAAQAANAHDFIVKFPDGYDTEVGERGGNLSGGERQRVSIARAILHNPRILILDEATSSVDVETEKQIQEAIDRLVQNRTTFAIAHRLSTLRNADRLFVIEKGKAVECGLHHELMQKKGTYYKLVQTQREAANVRAEAQIVER